MDSVIYRWFYAQNKSGFKAESFSSIELEYMEKWAIWKNFNKLPWEWFGDEIPLVSDMNAMQTMAAWDNDRERMTAEMDRQKSQRAAAKGSYSSNIRGPRYKID